MCTWTLARVCTWTHVNMNACMYVGMNACTYVHVNACMYVHMKEYTYVHVRTCTYEQMQAFKYTHLWLHTNMNHSYKRLHDTNKKKSLKKAKIRPFIRKSLFSNQVFKMIMTYSFKLTCFLKKNKKTFDFKWSF